VEFEIAGANVDQLVLRALPVSNLAGAVSYEEESAKPQRSSRIVLKEIGSDQGEHTADIEADGSFVLENIPAGHYVVSLSSQTAYLKSLSLGAASMAGRILDLTSGAGGASLAVVAGADGGEISGTVRDDKGLVAAFAVLVPEAEGAAGMQILIAQKGSYSFTALAPGDYKLFALPPGGAPQREAIGRDLDDYTAIAVHVSLAPHEKVTKDVTPAADQ
jgi:hypothetical protein